MGKEYEESDMKKAMEEGVLLLAAVMLLGLTACGKSESEAVRQTNSTSIETEETVATEKTEETDAEQQEKPAYVLTSPKRISTDFVDLTYDEADGWVLPENGVFDEERYSDISLVIPFEEGANIDRDEVPEQEGAGVYDQEVYVGISYSIEDVSAFRYYLTYYGLDQQKYADHGYDFTNIGGADCVMSEGENWGVPEEYYLGRVENANATVVVGVTGVELGDERVDKLLSGLTFKIKDTGNVDPPWSWEGETFTAKDQDVTVGEYSLHSQWIPIENGSVILDSYLCEGAIADGNVYFPIDGVLKCYEYNGTSLVFARNIELDDTYENIFTDENGTLWLSGYNIPDISIKDSVQTSYDELEGVLVMHPSGTWGILELGSEYKKVTFSGKKIEKQSMTFDEIDWIGTLLIDDNHIYACGDAADGSGHKVFVYDENGELQKTLTGEGRAALGSVTFVAETVNGFIALDAYNQEVVLWEKDGDYAGTVSHDELFGTNEPWFCGASVLDDGSFLVYMTDERSDGSAVELIVFKLNES